MSRDQRKVTHIKLLVSKTSNLSLEDHWAGTVTSWLLDSANDQLTVDQPVGTLSGVCPFAVGFGKFFSFVYHLRGVIQSTVATCQCACLFECAKIIALPI